MAQTSSKVEVGAFTYRSFSIGRPAWVARNRELAERGKAFGITLPAFSLEDVPEGETREEKIARDPFHGVNGSDR